MSEWVTGQTSFIISTSSADLLLAAVVVVVEHVIARTLNSYIDRHEQEQQQPQYPPKFWLHSFTEPTDHIWYLFLALWQLTVLVCEECNTLIFCSFRTWKKRWSSPSLSSWSNAFDGRLTALTKGLFVAVFCFYYFFHLWWCAPRELIASPKIFGVCACFN